MGQKAIAAGALALWTVPSLFAQGATEDVAKDEFLKYWRQVADNAPPRVEMRVDATLAGPQGEDGATVLDISKAEERQVTLGRSDAEYIEITAGLTEDDVVLVPAQPAVTEG